VTKQVSKSDLVALVAESANLTKADAGRAVDSALFQMAEAFGRGDKVALVGFGTFEVKHRAARSGRNPQTGETVQFPAKNVLKFKPSSALKL